MNILSPFFRFVSDKATNTGIFGKIGNALFGGNNDDTETPNNTPHYRPDPAAGNRPSNINNPHTGTGTEGAEDGNIILSIRDFIFDKIPGEGDIDYLYFGVIIYIIIRFIVKDKWGGFITYLIFAIVFIFTETTADTGLLSLLSEGGEITSKLAHLIAIPLLVTALTNDK